MLRTQRAILVAFGALLIFVALPTMVGCSPGDASFVIEVSGTTGTRFSGTYGAMRDDGRSSSTSVTGTVPAQYEVTGAIATAVFQKDSGRSETLTVTIKRGDRVLVRETTTAPYGVVSAGTTSYPGKGG